MAKSSQKYALDINCPKTFGSFYLKVSYQNINIWLFFKRQKAQQYMVYNLVREIDLGLGCRCSFETKHAPSKFPQCPSFPISYTTSDHFQFICMWLQSLQFVTPGNVIFSNMFLKTMFIIPNVYIQESMKVLFVKGQIINMLGFVGYMLSALVLQHKSNHT